MRATGTVVASGSLVVPNTIDATSSITKYSYTVNQLPADLTVDARGVYGYLPTENSQFSASKWPVDWTNPTQVASAQEVRLQYHSSIEEEMNFVQSQQSLGATSEDIARQLVDMRNQSRLSFYTEDQLPAIYDRNMFVYGNPFGPTYESQLGKYGTPDAVIQAGFRTNTTMDILTGIARVKQ